MKIFLKINLTFLLVVLFTSVYSQVAITSPTANVCSSKAVDGSAPGWTTLGNIDILEGNKADFPKKTGSVTLSAPTGWLFNTSSTITITFVANNLSSVGLVSLTSGALTFTWTAGGTNTAGDRITIAGLQVQASAMASADGPIYCSTSTQAIVGLTAGIQGTGSQLGYCSQIKDAEAGSYQTICSNVATMAANNPAPGTGSWTFISGPAAAAITASSSFSTGITGVSANGAYVFKWTTITSCGTTSANVVITRTTTPTSAAGTDQTFCFPNNTSLAANFPPVGSGLWSFVAGSANTSTTQISSLSDESAIFTPITAGTYSLQWSISLTGCTTNTDVVRIIVSPGPVAANAGPSRTICAGTGTTMAATAASGGASGAWSVVSGPSTLSTQFSSLIAANSSFTPAGGFGTYILAWTLTLSGCTSVSTTTVVVNPGPTTASAGADQTVCTFANLTANTPAVGTGSWTVFSGTGGGTFSSSTDPNGTFDPANQSTPITIRWTISSPGCTSSFDDVVITATCIPTTTLTIPSNSVTTTIVSLTGCPSTKIIFDNGGPSSDYAANALGAVTFSAPVGTCLSYSFTSFRTESSYDELILTSGATTFTYSGSAIPPSGSTTTNSLNVRFEADGSVQYAGFEMSISCANSCSGIPSAGIAVATPTVRCSTYTTNLSVSGGSSSECSITYQWQSASAIGGPYSNIGGATAKTATASVASTTYFRCITRCGVATNTIASSVATASLQSGGCGCPVSITLPYTSTGQTTCGQGNDITSGNVSPANGSANYYTGEDVVYTFTAAATGLITVDLTSSGSFTGLMLYRGCPTAAGAATVANAQDSYGNKSLCASVTSGQVYYLIVDSWSTPFCNPYGISISAPTGTAVACNMAYTAASTTYSFESFSGTLLPTTDDVLFNVGINFGFPICFDGTPYTGGYVASNAALVFDALQCFPNIQTSSVASGGVSTGFSITQPAPVNGTSIPRNAVLAPWHDIHPGLGTGLMQYATLGTAPNRRFIVSYENIPMYSCGTASTSIYFSSQIKLFETTNTIEIHIRKKGVCPGFNNGQAVMGLHNYNGTTYIPPVNNTMHNAVATPGPYNQWSMTNTAYAFTTSCGSAGACALILPIGLKTFYGERIDKVNNLYWETSSEENLKLFSVERSTDGLNFTEIGQVLAKNSPGKYHFEDKNSVPGMINYYQVRVKENNGTESSTNIISLYSGNGEILTVSQLFPNPATNSFMIGLDSKQNGKATINIYDIFGKVINSSDYTVNGGVNQYTISLEGFSKGVYYVEVLNSFNEMITKQKLVKQ
ncbi:MAG: T9SS type A sorting domain-containing protein [Bacteroidota bacterium]